MMHLYKPAFKRQPYVADFKYKTMPAEDNHTAHFKDLADRYEYWILLPDIYLFDILVYKEDETIEILQKDKLRRQPDIILETFKVPEDVAMGAIHVKEFAYGINIIMPKIPWERSTENLFQ